MTKASSNRPSDRVSLAFGFTRMRSFTLFSEALEEFHVFLARVVGAVIVVGGFEDEVDVLQLGMLHEMLESVDAHGSLSEVFVAVLMRGKLNFGIITVAGDEFFEADGFIEKFYDVVG